jgi:hypothetical protein
VQSKAALVTVQVDSPSHSGCCCWSHLHQGGDAGERSLSSLAGVGHSLPAALTKQSLHNCTSSNTTAVHQYTQCFSNICVAGADFMPVAPAHAVIASVQGLLGNISIEASRQSLLVCIPSLSPSPAACFSPRSICPRHMAQAHSKSIQCTHAG